jgi:hypothetical protein
VFRSDRIRAAGTRTVRTRAAAFAALVMVALAGCVAIPTSGTVTVGAEPGDDVEPELVFQPSGPGSDAAPEDIIRGFVQAAIGPQNSYAVARKFLVPSFAEEWDPNERTLIRSGQQSVVAVGPNSYELAFTATASVDASGLYTPLQSPTPTRVGFTLVENDGEWRIADTGSGIVLTEQYFNDIFEPYPLYFYAPGYTHLVPDLRWFPSIATTSTRLVRELLAGPSEWMQPPAVVTAFPEGTEVSLVEVDSGRALVDLSSEARAERLSMQRMKLQLSSTLASVPSIQSVGVSIDRTPTTIEDLGSSGPIVDPQVNGSPLVYADGGFGFMSNGVVHPLPGIGEHVASLAPAAVTVSDDETLAAVLNDAGVWAVRDGEEPILLDARSGLAPPSLDIADYVWSIQSGSSSEILVFGPTGESSPVAVTWGEGGTVVSMDVSRDGSRLLVLLDSGQGPQMIVASIVRDDAGTPVRLTSPVLELAAEPGAPLDATWVDDVTVASLTRTAEGDEAAVMLQSVGGQSEELASVAGGVAIVGGNGRSNLRVITSDGVLQVPRGSGWQRAGNGVSTLATQR